MAATVTESGGVKVVTEVIRQTDPRTAQLDSTAPRPSSAEVKGFRKAQPKALGLVSSGSMLVETERRESIWLVKVCYIISGLVILATLTAMIIHSVELGQDIPWCSMHEGGKMTPLDCSQNVYVL